MSNIINNKCHTSCKNCDFAIYVDNQQVACEFGIIKTYKDNLIEAYDEDLEFFILNNVECLYKRTSTDDKEIKKQSVINIMQFANRFQVIVYCEKTDEQALRDTINSLLNSSLPPKYITFMVEYGAFYPSEFFVEIFKNTGIEWRVENQLEVSKGFRYLVDHMLVAPKYKKTWYCLFTQGFKVDPNYFTKVSNVIDKERRQVLIFTPIDSHNYLTVHKNLDGFLGGNRIINIEEKIHNYNLEHDFPSDHLCMKSVDLI